MQLSFLTLTFVLLVVGTGSPGCSQTGAPANAVSGLASSPSPKAMTYRNEVFRDTVYLSDLATAEASTAAGTIYALPPVLSFINCEFAAPVFSTRDGGEVQGGSLSFMGSTFASDCQLAGLSLAHHLEFNDVVVQGHLMLPSVRVNGRLDLRGATVAGNVRIGSARIGDFFAKKVSFEQGLSLQRTTIIGVLSLIEARVAGYLDGSYLDCRGQTFFDLLKSHDRVMLDHAEFRGMVSFHSAEIPSLQARQTIFRGKVQAMPEGAVVD